MNARTFVDTNVLVYAFDFGSPLKRERARSVLFRLASEGAIVLSAQVLQEFYVTTTRKLVPPLSPEDAEAVVQRYAGLPLVTADAELVLAAIRTCRRYQISLWDALILRSAIAAGCQVVLSEDLQDGLQVESVRVENPFADQ